MPATLNGIPITKPHSNEERPTSNGSLVPLPVDFTRIFSGYKNEAAQNKEHGAPKHTGYALVLPVGIAYDQHIRAEGNTPPLSQRTSYE